jgi:hypothetical protein
MPFLPREAEPMKLMVENKLTEVLVFRYLPVLWYKHPIPNELREYWYYQRPDILEYMEKTYKELEIQFLPDNLPDELNDGSLDNKAEELTENLFDLKDLSDDMPDNLIEEFKNIVPDELTDLLPDHASDEFFEKAINFVESETLLGLIFTNMHLKIF